MFDMRHVAGQCQRGSNGLEMPGQLYAPRNGSSRFICAPSLAFSRSDVCHETASTDWRRVSELVQSDNSGASIEGYSGRTYKVVSPFKVGDDTAFFRCAYLRPVRDKRWQRRVHVNRYTMRKNELNFTSTSRYGDKIFADSQVRSWKQKKHSSGGLLRSRSSKITYGLIYLPITTQKNPLAAAPLRHYIS